MMDDLEQATEDVYSDNEASDNDSTKNAKTSILPLAQCTFAGESKAGTSTDNGFHQTTRVCLEQIREALLHQRWQEAAEYMACYCQILEHRTKTKIQLSKEHVWRLTTAILHHHPKSTLQDYNVIYEQMKHSGLKQYLAICMEHSFHLMLHGQIEEAKRHLTAAESWRHGQESAAQYKTTKLIQAYKSFLDYIIWFDKKSKYSNLNDAETDLGENQELHNYFRHASVNLKEILKNPGVWDPFIHSYIEMLEFYNDHERALKVLEDYAYDKSFPPNPNTFVYLYRYLQRQRAPKRKLTKVLKVLHALVPSHELMLEYTSLLLLSDQKRDVQKALRVVLDMLDYSCWRRNLDVWKRLKDIINRLQLEEDWTDVVSEKMAPRTGWWPALHFTRFHASEDAQTSPELMALKASLAEILCPDSTLAKNFKPQEGNRPHTESPP